MSGQQRSDAEDSAARRLLRFALAVGLSLLSLEVAARLLGDRLHASTNRGLYKLALLERRGPVETIFLGSSRTQDGVSPLRFDRQSGSGRSFNLAYTSSTLASLEATAAQISGRPGLSLALVELSTPQLVEGGVTWEEAPAAAPSAGGATLEAALGVAARDHVALVRNRAALIPENLGRLLALLAPAGRLDGSEVRVAEQLGAAIGLRWPEEPSEAAAWEPPQTAAGPPLPASHPYGEACARLTALAQRLAAAGVRPVFVIPPFSPEARPFGHDPERGAEFQALAAALAASYAVLDGSRVEQPKACFHDTTHLDWRGRDGWSRGLALAVRRVREGKR